MKIGPVALALGILGYAGLWACSASGAAPVGDPVKGKKLFESSCAGCHPGGGNSINPADPIKGPKFAKEFADDKKIVDVVRKGIKGSAMPPFGVKQVSDPDLQNIVAYIRTLTPKGR